MIYNPSYPRPKRPPCGWEGPGSLICDRPTYHLGWHSVLHDGKFYEWAIDRQAGIVLGFKCNGEDAEVESAP